MTCVIIKICVSYTEVHLRKRKTCWYSYQKYIIQRYNRIAQETTSAQGTLKEHETKQQNGAKIALKLE